MRLCAPRQGGPSQVPNRPRQLAGVLEAPCKDADGHVGDSRPFVPRTGSVDLLLHSAQSCRERHQNPASGGPIQVAELRVGDLGPDHGFLPGYSRHLSQCRISRYGDSERVCRKARRSGQHAFLPQSLGRRLGGGLGSNSRFDFLHPSASSHPRRLKCPPAMPYFAISPPQHFCCD